MESSRLESSQDGMPPMPPKRKRHGISAQETGTLVCKYCPFRTDKKDSLIRHEKHHSANHPFQCNFCTFSAKSKWGLSSHINRVHQDELKSNGDVVQPTVIEKEAINVEFAGEWQHEDLSLSKDQVQQKDPLKSAQEAGVLDITMESDDEEEEGVLMVSERVLEEMNCICGQPQPSYGDGSAISCSQCDDRYHGYCVHITPEVYKQMDEFEEPWICQRCIIKGRPIRQKTTLAQALNASDKQHPPSPMYSSSPVPDLSDNGHLEPQSQHENLLPTSETPTPSLSPQEEESIYSSEQSNLLQEIQTAGEILSDMKKSLKEETRKQQMARSRVTNDLRKKMEQVEKELRCQTVHLAVLMEQSESFRQQLNELRAKKIQLEQDINNLRKESVGKKKIKLEPIASESSPADVGEEIRRKKGMLNDAKEKLPAIQREETHLASRIRGVEEEMTENTLKLAKMRYDMESLKGNRAAETRQSAIAVQLKALIGGQCIRIKRFTWLEIKLAKINYKLRLDEIRREKEQWLKDLMDYNME